MPERIRKAQVAAECYSVLQCPTGCYGRNAAAAASGACPAAGSGPCGHLCAAARVHNHSEGARACEAARQPRVHDRAVAAAAGVFLPCVLRHLKHSSGHAGDIGLQALASQEKG